MRRFPAGAKLSVVSKVLRPVLGPTQPPIQLVPGSYFLRVRRPWLEVDHSALSSAEVKNKWSYTSTAAYAFIACTGNIELSYNKYYAKFNSLGQNKGRASRAAARGTNL
jgi:hypothetical protein